MGKAGIFAMVLALTASMALGFGKVLAHGDGAPQPVDITGLEALGEEWRTTNPYRGLPRAIEIGSSGYNSNCARCHGLEAKSGGIAPDLRYLEETPEGDEWYLSRVRYGVSRDGATKMPKFDGLLSQEAMWAIRSYVDSRPEDD